jgi:hypothetical protein
MIPLTKYQLSLFRKSPFSWRNLLWRIGQLSVLALFCMGLFAEIQGTLPTILYGWVVFCILAYILYNCVVVLVWLFFRIALYFIAATLKSTKNSFDDDVKALHSKARYYFMSIFEFGIHNEYTLSWITVLDIMLDWSVFALLVTANHPVLAILHGGSLLGQYFVLSSVKNAIRAIVATLDDPLDAELDIDKLMDQLCDEGNKPE